MKALRWVRLTGGGVAALLLLLCLTLMMIDPADIFGVVTRLAARQGVSVTAKSITRRFPLGLRMESVSITSDRPILVIDRLDIQIPILQLLTGTATARITGSIGEGNFTVTASGRTTPMFTIDARQIRLERIPILAETLSGTVTGGVSVSGTVTGIPPKTRGEIRIDSRGIETRGITIGGVPLPDSIYRSFRGALTVSGDKLEVTSFSLDGEGIYLRLSGSIPLSPPIMSAPLSLTLEILPRPEIVERQKLVFLLLSRYLTSPGSYRLPLSGTLASPRIF